MTDRPLDESVLIMARAPPAQSKSELIEFRACWEDLFLFLISRVPLKEFSVLGRAAELLSDSFPQFL